MAKNKKTPKEAMKYWAVGWRPMKIKARTARIAVRKYMRNNLVRDIAVRDYELDNVFGSDTIETIMVRRSTTRRLVLNAARRYTVKDIPVKPW